MKMPIDIKAAKGRGTAKDGATKQWKDPISGKTGAPGNDPGAVTSIAGQVDKNSGRNSNSSSDV